jgi:hypothetical protein
MYTEARDFQGVIQPLANQIGQRVKLDLTRSMRSFWLDCRITATVTLAAAVTGPIINQGSVMALIDQIGVLEGGEERINITGQMAAALTDRFALGPRSNVRLTSLANGATNLEETVRLFFARPDAVNQAETTFIERNPQKAFQVFAQFNNNNLALVTALGPGTLTITNFTISVTQRFDDDRTDRTVFVPTMRTLSLNVAGANTALRFPLDTTKFVQGLGILQFGDNRQVADVINTIKFLGDNRVFRGPADVPYRDLVLSMQEDTGGAVGPVNQPGFLFLDMRPGGRLSNILDPNRDVNLRFTLGVQPSVGATATRVDVALLELEKIPGITVEHVPFTV